MRTLPRSNPILRSQMIRLVTKPLVSQTNVESRTSVHIEFGSKKILYKHVLNQFVLTETSHCGPYLNFETSCISTAVLFVQ